MKKTKEYINYKNNFFYIICLIITIIIFIPFLLGHYAGDTYNIQALGYNTYALNYNLKDGRPLIAMFNLIVGKLNLSINSYVFLTLFLALIISNISVIILKKIADTYKQPQNIKQDIIITLISYVLVFNFMYIDCLNFAESPFIALSVLLFIKAAYILCENKKNSFLKSGVLACIAILCYQSSISMFFACLFLFTILKNKNNIKQIFKDLLKGGIITIIILLVNYIAIKLAGYVFDLNQDRVKISIDIILRNIRLTLHNVFNILNASCNLFPNSLFLYYICVITTLGVVYAIKTKQEDAFVYKFFLIIIVSIISSFILNIISTSSFSGGRTRLSIGATIGIIFMFLYVESDIFNSRKIFCTILIIILLTYMLINIHNYEYLMIQQKKLNILEEKEMLEIENYIDEYEKNTGVKIDEIAKVLFKNQQEKQYYQELPQNPFTSSIVRSSEFADRALNFHSGKNLSSKLIYQNSKESEEYLKVENNDKGYECIGNTLYLSVYSY